MIAVDTSSLIEYFNGSSGRDVDAIQEAFEEKSVMLPHATYLEILSDPKLPDEVALFIKMIPTTPIASGFWERAASSRRILLSKKRNARVADVLIAQSCIDHRLKLITRDSDFKSFEKYLGLEVLWA